MLIYSISKGIMTSTTRGFLWSGGYAGNGIWKNDPKAIAVKGHGPLPIGDYRMTGMRSSPNTGPGTIVLEPVPGTPMFGRGDFRIHGDKSSDPGNASDGCICKSPIAERVKCWAENDKILRVIA